MSESVFGNIFVGTVAEEAVLDTLKYWFETYLREVERQLGLEPGRIPTPKTYSTRNENTSFPDDILPLCLAVSPGLAEPPLAEGDGTYRAWFSIGVGFAVAAKDAESSMFVAKIMGATARAILLHKQSLGGVAAGVEWMDESYDDLVDEDERTIRACYNVYRVLIYNVTKKFAGPSAPADPVTQPGSTWPPAEKVVIDDIKVIP